MKTNNNEDIEDIIKEEENVSQVLNELGPLETRITSHDETREYSFPKSFIYFCKTEQFTNDVNELFQQFGIFTIKIIDHVASYDYYLFGRGLIFLSIILHMIPYFNLTKNYYEHHIHSEPSEPYFRINDLVKYSIQPLTIEEIAKFVESEDIVEKEKTFKEFEPIIEPDITSPAKKTKR